MGTAPPNGAVNEDCVDAVASGSKAERDSALHVSHSNKEQQLHYKNLVGGLKRQRAKTKNSKRVSGTISISVDDKGEKVLGYVDCGSDVSLIDSDLVAIYGMKLLNLDEDSLIGYKIETAGLTRARISAISDGILLGVPLCCFIVWILVVQCQSRLLTIANLRQNSRLSKKK